MKNFLISLLLSPLIAMATTNTIVYNVTSNRVISGDLIEEKVSIASISKLMTVYTVLTQNQPMNEKLTVKGNKVPNTRISKGMVLTRHDLLKLALVGSDNLAAVTLSENYPGGRIKFIEEMNHNARALGMVNSGFVEPTGLSPMNYSTIQDVIRLTTVVSSFEIVQLAAQSHGEVTQYSKGKKNAKFSSNPTSKYFGQQGIIAIKTGFTKAAGFCITMLVNVNNQLYNITVLGAKTKQERETLINQSLDIIYRI
jgi:D-alanyl-D-alanine endopeptidase (penicillin-binding protein 7)